MFFWLGMPEERQVHVSVGVVISPTQAAFDCERVCEQTDGFPERTQTASAFDIDTRMSSGRTCFKGKKKSEVRNNTLHVVLLLENNQRQHGVKKPSR